MRIAHLLVTGGWGGAEMMACALAERASRDGHTVSLDAAPRAQAGLRTAGYSDIGTESHLLPWAIAAHRRLAHFAPDLVHAHLSTPAFALTAALALGKLRSLTTCHLLPEQRWPNDFLLPISSKKTLDLATRSSRTVLVAVSQTGADELKRYVSPDRVRVVLNSPVEQSSSSVTLPDDKFGSVRHKLLAVGRLVPQKGFDRLLDALGARPFASFDFRLVIVGAGPEEPALKSRCEALGISDRVSFAGGIPARSLMKSADLIVCASRYEGMPLVPMEGVLAGCAVVASSIAPHRELFDGIADALLPDDPAHWSEFLAALVSDEKRLDELKRTQSSRRPLYSFERMWRDYSNLYEDLVAPR